MLKIEDIHELAYSDELISAGISYVGDSLSSSKTREEKTDFDNLRHQISEKAVELAFRRYLGDQKVPHQLLEIPGFGNNPQHLIQLGGRRCQIVNLLLSNRKKVKDTHLNLGQLLSYQAVLPQAQFKNGEANDALLIFTAMTGLVTRSLADLKKSINAAQSIHLMYQFPQAWAQPSAWNALGPLVAKGNSRKEHQLEINGQDNQRESFTSQLHLPIKERILIEGDFYSLRQLKIDTLPDGPIGIHSPGLQYTLLIAPYQWGNLWVYGMKIYLLGFQSFGEFNQQANPVVAGSNLLGQGTLTQDSLAMPMENLRPISDLFDRARKWAER